MTYEERERQICRECRKKVECPYIPRKLEYKCQHLSDITLGWELGNNDAIERACEYLKANYEDIGIRYIRGHEVENEIEIFKKFMEEQQ